MSLKLGSSGFSCNQNNHGLWDAYVTCIYPSLSVKINMCKMPHGAQRSWMCLFCVHFCVWSAKTQRPPISAPWLTTPLKWVIYEVWDLPCISVVIKFLYCLHLSLNFSLIKMLKLCHFQAPCHARSHAKLTISNGRYMATNHQMDPLIIHFIQFLGMWNNGITHFCPADVTLF